MDKIALKKHHKERVYLNKQLSLRGTIRIVPLMKIIDLGNETLYFNVLRGATFEHRYFISCIFRYKYS